MPQSATSEELEKVAVAILAKELDYWRRNDLPFHAFDDEVALEILVERGIRPSRLGFDLDYLISLAYRRSMQGDAPCLN